MCMNVWCVGTESVLHVLDSAHRQTLPIKSSSSSPGESQASPSSGSPLEFIVDLSEAFGRAEEGRGMMRQRGGVGRGRYGIGGGSSLLANKISRVPLPCQGPGN